MTIKTVTFMHAITIAGTNVAADFTLQPDTKHRGVKATMAEEGVLIEHPRGLVLVPYNNVKQIDVVADAPTSEKKK